jgi:hypothetical protein
LKDYETFKRHFKTSGGFVLKCGVFIKMMRLFENIFREIEAFIKITRFFEDIFRII